MVAFDHGLGTTFERFAIYQWLGDLAESYPIHTVLEGPGDGVAGITGIHSIPLAQIGCEVAVALEDTESLAQARQAWTSEGCSGSFILVGEAPLPFGDGTFDLVWNFNRLPFLDPQALVAEMARLSRRYVALVVPNRRNYGFPARRLYHRRTAEPWPYGDTSVMTPGAVLQLIEHVCLRVIEVRWVDVPWWPDILDPIAWLEALIPGAGHHISSDRGEESRYRWGPTTLPYFDTVTYADVHRRMHRLGWMERHLPASMQMPFAHHFAVLAAVGERDA